MAVMIYHASLGKTINYGEMDQGHIAVSVGQSVKKGQYIGRAGHCGMLHFEVYTGRQSANARWLPPAGQRSASPDKCARLYMHTKPRVLEDPRPWMSALQHGTVPGSGSGSKPPGSGTVDGPKCAKIGGKCTLSCNGGKVTTGLCPGQHTCCVRNSGSKGSGSASGSNTGKCKGIGGKCTMSCDGGKVTRGLCGGAYTCCVKNASGSASTVPGPKCARIGGKCTLSCQGGKVTTGLCPGAHTCCVKSQSGSGSKRPSGSGTVAGPKCARIGGKCTMSCNGGKVTTGLCPGVHTCCVRKPGKGSNKSSSPRKASGSVSAKKPKTTKNLAKIAQAAGKAEGLKKKTEKARQQERKLVKRIDNKVGKRPLRQVVDRARRQGIPTRDLHGIGLRKRGVLPGGKQSRSRRSGSKNLRPGTTHTSRPSKVARVPRSSSPRRSRGNSVGKTRSPRRSTRNQRYPWRRSPRQSRQHNQSGRGQRRTRGNRARRNQRSRSTRRSPSTIRNRQYRRPRRQNRRTNERSRQRSGSRQSQRRRTTPRRSSTRRIPSNRQNRRQPQRQRQRNGQRRRTSQRRQQRPRQQRSPRRSGTRRKQTRRTTPQRSRQPNSRRSPRQYSQRRTQRPRQQRRTQPYRRRQTASRRTSQRYPQPSYYRRARTWTLDFVQRSALNSDDRRVLSVFQSVIGKLQSRFGTGSDFEQNLGDYLGSEAGKVYADEIAVYCRGGHIKPTQLSSAERVEINQKLASVLGQSLLDKMDGISQDDMDALLSKLEVELENQNIVLNDLKSALATHRDALRINHDLKKAVSPHHKKTPHHSKLLKSHLGKIARRTRQLIRRIENRSIERRLHARTRSLIKRITAKLQFGLLSNL